MTTKIQLALRKALRDTSTGLSINELASITGYLATSVRRTVAHHMPDVYIAAWRELYRSRPTALYKAAMIPEDAPEPPPKPISVYKNKVRDTRPKPEPTAEPNPRKFTSSGLTTIRGPWPTWENK